MSAYVDYPRWQDVPAALWDFEFFSPKEMACRRSGSIKVARSFMLKLDRLRRLHGRPLRVNSGYRSPEHDAAIGGAGVHPTGHAVDLGVKGAVQELIVPAVGLGFTGIGLQQKGDHASRFIHLDDLKGTARRPRPWLWTY